MGFVVLGKHHRRVRRHAGLFEPLFDGQRNPELFLHPDRQGHQERPQPERRHGKIGLQEAVELGQGLVVEGDSVQLAGADAALRQAIAQGVDGKGGIVLLAREALLLRGRHDAAITNQTGGAIVIAFRALIHQGASEPASKKG
jgi:hypothetical protein